MRKSRLVILPTKCLNQIGFLLLFLSCPVIGDWGRIQPESEASHNAIQIAKKGTCGLQRDAPGGLWDVLQELEYDQCRPNDYEPGNEETKNEASEIFSAEDQEKNKEGNLGVRRSFRSNNVETRMQSRSAERRPANRHASRRSQTREGSLERSRSMDRSVRERSDRRMRSLSPENSKNRAAAQRTVDRIMRIRREVAVRKNVRSDRNTRQEEKRVSRERGDGETLNRRQRERSEGRLIVARRKLSIESRERRIITKEQLVERSRKIERNTPNRIVARLEDFSKIRDARKGYNRRVSGIHSSKIGDASHRSVIESRRSDRRENKVQRQTSERRMLEAVASRREERTWRTGIERRIKASENSASRGGRTNGLGAAALQRKFPADYYDAPAMKTTDARRNVIRQGKTPEVEHKEQVQEFQEKNYDVTKIGQWTLNCVAGAVAYYMASRQVKIM